MTTPAVNINAASNAVATRTQRNAAGTIVQITPLVIAGGRLGKFRPESVNNPIRFDNTRKPANWVSQGGTWRTAYGTAVIRHPNGSTWTTEGALVVAPPSVGSIPPVIPIADGNAYSIRDALGHYAEASQKLGVALAEVRQTAGLVTQYYHELSRSLGKVADALQDDRKGTFRKQMGQFAKGWTKAPARYLEYLYGVRPLAGEISNAVDVLTDIGDQGYQFKMTLMGKYRTSAVVTQSHNTTIYSTTATTSLSVRQTHRASLVFTLPEWFWEELPPVTPFSVAYETTSMSFVLDWLIPIGAWLRGFEGLQLRPFFTEGSTTCFIRRRSEGPVQFNTTAGYSRSTVPVRISHLDYYMNRVAFDSFPTELVMRLPMLRSSLGLDKMDQMSALAGQRFANLSKTIARYY